MVLGLPDVPRGSQHLPGQEQPLSHPDTQDATTAPDQGRKSLLHLYHVLKKA